MLRKSLFASLLILLLGIVGCSGDESSEENGAIENETTAVNDKAQEFYNKKCANCHGQNLEGIVGPTLITAGSMYDEEELLDIIVNGIDKTTMPGGLLEGEEAEVVAQWLAQQK
ncbi:c-type cytochrome [Lysinibacillus sp. NPDC048646]|uniref:c-type cytochrome n=1 Tax=Lysinibacillus sp. NPDC048646 TaxID=3390574 RepID=UPI003D012B4D